LSGDDFAVEITAVKPHALYGAHPLAYGDFKEGHAAGAHEERAADFADEGDHLAGLKGGDVAGVDAVFVAKGEVIEQVFDGDDAAFG
jgi:hypothetical protein